MNYKAILFDLGGVLIDVDYQKTIDAFIDLGMENFDECYSQANQTKLFDEFEIGKISEQRFINSLLPYLRPGTSPNQAVHAWCAMVIGFKAQKVDLLAKFKEKYPLYMLSNTNALHMPVVNREWDKVSDKPLEFYFEKIFLSHEIHKRKPHPETFEFVCSEIKFKPEEVLFIDDSIQHVEGAKKAGLQAMLLQDDEKLFQLIS